MPTSLTFGAPISVHPDVDPLDDLQWADAQPDIDAAWLIDHLQGWYPRGTRRGALADPHRLLEPFSVLAAGAAQTRRVSLGVAVTDPLRRTAVALAQAASSISWLGRRPMKLGVGVGDPGQLRPFGVHPGVERTGRLGYFRPALQQLDGFRRPPETGPDLALAIDAPYELHVAAHGPRMLELTAAHADGWIPSSLSPADYADRLTTLRRHAVDSGRDPEEITPTLFVWSALGSTREESERLLRHPSVRAVALFRGRAAFERHGATYPLPHGYIPDEIRPEQADSLLESIPDAVVADAVLHGSPEDVRETLERYREAGCEHVICHDIGRFVDPDGTARFREGLLAVTKS
ncbi:phthiodiolone/phenolphthiodiolone dimycocerosates ketoreductase [Pseudonocardia ammonioxydans]|uniref:Phthiodiolone/phenolphthiodiolone dimycocerosates ketoreductase n=1 Tax=Pseudonocardia ammonioxydans TaxID=260086 RepID=A0A1I4S7C9_PSUAM|nr:LLM class flavin-dependent oxidoreductase [Pseudonocardia ammonioxydans]SFM60369.1 phthiodiolone/phenolphthiodiolone dimycocerosates ketoreductase [Pseudonocardia ammonioxydans]